jgi:hypothetical protein
MPLGAPPDTKRAEPRDRWSVAWGSLAAVWALTVAVLALRPQPAHLAGSSALSHLVAFGGLTFLTCTAAWRPGSWPRPRLLAMAGIVTGLFLFGVGIEAAQGLLLDSRFASRRDVAVNTLGVLAGFSAWAMWWISAAPRGREAPQ